VVGRLFPPGREGVTGVGGVGGLGGGGGLGIRGILNDIVLTLKSGGPTPLESGFQQNTYQPNGIKCPGEGYGVTSVV
jgi:hypothetical protein